MSRVLTHSIALAIILSALFHLGLWGTLVVLPPSEPASPQENIEVVILDSSQNKKMQSQQIVEQDQRRVNDEVPEDSKYLSRHNQRVKRQTRAESSGKFSNAAGMGGVGQGSAQGQHNNQNTSTAKQAKAPQKLSKTAKTGLPSLRKLVPRFQPEAQLNQKNQQGAGRQRSQSSDYLKDKDIEKGMQTVLSTREFLYYSYYQRIRDKIRQHWEPAIRAKVIKLFRQGRSIASARDRVTQVVIILDKDGTLINVQVIGESGVRDLDDVAIEAFRAAEPFPNPPKGIVEKDGKIRIRWDFVLEAQWQNQAKEELVAQKQRNLDAAGG